MSLGVICLVALLGSALTFFSGFGLGTVLLPVFALFFPLSHAIAYTAVVHLANNLFKSGLTFRNVNWLIFFHFSLFSIPAAFMGAYLLRLSLKIPVLYSYTLFDSYDCSIQFSGLIIGIIMIFFAFIEFFPFLNKMILKGEKLGIGGLVSGFFGGFTGHQGALRSAWLIRVFKNKESYIATGIFIAIAVDLTRLSVYSGMIMSMHEEIRWKYVVFPMVFAFLGAWFGNRLLKKITLKWMKLSVLVLLLVIGFLTMAGILNPKI